MSKRNRFHQWQERSLLLTTKHIVNIKRKENENDLSFQRVISISQLSGLTKSSGKKSTQFIVHIKDQYDYLLFVEDTEIFAEYVAELKKCYFNLMNRNLPIFAVKDSIENFCTS